MLSRISSLMAGGHAVTRALGAFHLATRTGPARGGPAYHRVLRAVGVLDTLPQDHPEHAVLRRLPGALKDERSAVEESFTSALDGDPEYPHYTRPAEYRGWHVPEVLLSGHHERIGAWRRERSAERGELRDETRSG